MSGVVCGPITYSVDINWHCRGLPRALRINYSIDEDCPYLKQLLGKVYDEGFIQGYEEGHDSAN